ncbi:virulence associated lipoprotein [Borreliella bavariensis]|uniref:virulence associated lipoprotein n=1 Tax=Borreliella bavariensis TaxID=664662 RepID=UPI001C005A86|nr:virulence associated lipoprotein [Borreliella bavariensis]
MKYLVIINVFFLLFSACTPDFGINKKNIKPPSSKKALKPKTEIDSKKKEIPPIREALKPSTEADSKKEEVLPIREALKPSTEADPKQEEDPDKKIKNTLLNNLRSLIEVANAHKEKYKKIMEEEPDDQYGILAFKEMHWKSGDPEALSGNSEKARKYRRHTYTILSAIDTKDLKEFSNIIILADLRADTFNIFSSFGYVLDIVTDHLYPKKDTLYKLDTSDLEKLKQSLEKVLSIIKSVSEESKQLLLDYQSDKNSIKTDVAKLKSHLNTLNSQRREKVTEAESLQNVILSI